MKIQGSDLIFMSFESVEEFGILGCFYHENLNKMLMFKFNNQNEA